MALQLKIDATGVETGAAQAKVALDALIPAAVKVETAIEKIGKTGLPGVIPLAAAVKQTDVAFAATSKTATALVAAQTALSVSATSFSAKLPALAAAQMAQTVATEAEIAALALQVQAFEKLQASIAPAITAEMRMAEVQAQASAAVRAGIATQEDANAIMARATERFTPAITAVESFGHGVERAGAKSALSYMQVQELGHVTRSVAGVMMAGGSALQAFEFEASRIASVLMQGNGPVATIKALGGAVAGFLGPVGLGVLAVGALGAALYEFGPNVAAAVKMATDANDAYIASFDLIKKDIDEVSALEGDYTQALKTGSTARIAAIKNEAVVRADLLRLDLLDQQDAKASAAKAVAGAQREMASAKQMQSDMQLILSQSIKTGQAEEDQQAAAKNSREATAAVTEQNRALERVQDNYALINDKITAGEDKLAATKTLLADIAAGTTSVAAGTAGAAASSVGLATQLQGVGQWALVAANHVAGFTPALNSATAAAGGLAGAMGGVAIAANAALSQMIQMDATRRTMQGRVQAVAAGFVGMPERTPDQLVADRTAVNTAKSQIALKAAQDALAANKPSGGGTSAIDKTKAAYDSLMSSLDPVVAATQKYDAALKTVNAEYATGAISDAEKAKALGLIKSQYDAATASVQSGAGVWATFQTAGGNAIDKLISGTGSLKSAIRDMIKEMEIALIKGALLGHVAGGGGGDSIGQLLVKGIFGGFHDAGGMIPAGTTGMVGERGPELVTAGRNGAMVTSRVDTARQMQGGQQAVHVTVGVSVDDAGNLKAYVKNVAQAAGAQAVQSVKRNLNGWNNQLATDGALA